VLAAALQCALARHDYVTARDIALQLPLNVPAATPRGLLLPLSVPPADPVAGGAPLPLDPPSPVRPPWVLCLELAQALAGTTRGGELAARALILMPPDALATHGHVAIDASARADAVAWARRHHAATTSTCVHHGGRTGTAAEPRLGDERNKRWKMGWAICAKNSYDQGRTRRGHTHPVYLCPHQHGWQRLRLRLPRPTPFWPPHSARRRWRGSTPARPCQSGSPSAHLLPH
jgi:hypothetical protein